MILTGCIVYLIFSVAFTAYELYNAPMVPDDFNDE